MIFTTALLLLLGACSPKSEAPSAAAGPELSLYERIGAKLAGRRDLDHLGEPPPELEKVTWMQGQWRTEATVFATPSSPESVETGRSVITAVIGGCWLQMADTYPQGTQDLGFLTYNPVTKQWVSIGLDSAGNAVTATGNWEADKLVLTARAQILGEDVMLRQSMRKLGDDEFLLLNEEQRRDGSWVKLDQYRYRRAR